MHRQLSIASVLVFGFAAFTMLPGCTAKAGDACTKGTASCADGSNELTCQDGKFIQAPCKGAKGCKVEGEKMTCDISANKAGDVCSKDDEGNSACTADGKSLIQCLKGAYVVSACGGPAACKQKDSKYECDKSIAAVGDSCEGAGNACSTDGKSLLECKGGKLAASAECKGAKGCKVEGDKINCDVGDAAQAAEPTAAPSADPSAAPSAAPTAAPAAD